MQIERVHGPPERDHIEIYQSFSNFEYNTQQWLPHDLASMICSCITKVS
jgi:hypothetical protein